MTGIALEDAHQLLSAAIQQLGPRRPTGPCLGTNTVEAARLALENLQKGLVVAIDRAHGEPLTPYPIKAPQVVILRVPVTVETLAELRRLVRQSDETSPEMVAAAILHDAASGG